jgi:hypothetical protein
VWKFSKLRVLVHLLILFLQLPYIRLACVPDKLHQQEITPCKLRVLVGRSKAPSNTDTCPGDQNRARKSSEDFVPLLMCEDEYANIFRFHFEEVYQLKLGVLVQYTKACPTCVSLFNVHAKAGVGL